MQCTEALGDQASRESRGTGRSNKQSSAPLRQVFRESWPGGGQLGFGGLWSYLGLCLATMQRVQVVDGALGGRPRVSQDLKGVEVVAQGVRSDE